MISRFIVVCMIVCGLISTRVAAQQQKLAGFDCLIKPHSIADVSTREQGVVTALLVSRGDLITKGQAIARLDADIEEATVKLATARTQMQSEIEEKQEDIAFTKRELERVKELHQKKAISAREVDQAATEAVRAELQLAQALARLKVAKFELERSEKMLKRRTLYSPINGVVVERKISLGESVDNRSILQVAEVDPLNVELIVPVEFFGRIKTGIKAKVLPKYPGAVDHVALVTIVDRMIDPASDTFGVRLELPNPSLDIPGGVRCEIEFIGQ